MATVWFGLGSNIGNRLGHIETALERLGTFVENLEAAPMYDTAPQDYAEQGDFLNTVARGECALPPLEILERVHEIEQRGGRNRLGAPPKGPRTIDIDILLIGSVIRTWVSEGSRFLTIPHASMHERLFVLRPLLDLDPHASDPRDGILWSLKASHLEGQRVKLYSP